jgi:phospholipid/cholesterol/gamma-HCH transport system permease protein
VSGERGKVVTNVRELGSYFLGFADTVGGLGVLFARIALSLFRLSLDRRELVQNLYKMGVKSLPIVVVTAIFVGGIIVIQAAPLVERYGAHALLGWGAGFSILREIGPLLTALMISGRVGANNTAELGTMVVTEQVDALRALAINPMSFLVVPRFVAILVTLFFSTVFANALALLGAAYMGAVILGVDPVTFENGLTGGLLGVVDVVHGLAKSIFFGLIIALSSCHFGLNTRGGAPGVGEAVNRSVVTSAAGVFVFDYLLSFVLG